MIKITKGNMMELVGECMDIHRRYSYHSECFSTSEIRLELELEGDIDTILNAIKRAGVNTAITFAALLKEYGWTAPVAGQPDEKQNNFETYVYCSHMERFLDSKWIIEGEMPATVNLHYTELETGIARFRYQKWDITDEAIGVLLKDSMVANRFMNIIKIVSRKYSCGGEHMLVSSIECIRDIYAAKPNDVKEEGVDCSSFLIELVHPNISNGDKVILLVKAGGFYDDIIIGKRFDNGNYFVEKLIPLEGVDMLDVRVRGYSSKLLDTMKKYIHDFESYRCKLITAA